MCTQLEIRFVGGGSSFIQLPRTSCNSHGCEPAISEAQLYHLAASGLFESVNVIHEGNGSYFGGAGMAQLVAAYEEKRAKQLAENIHVTLAIEPKLLEKKKGDKEPAPRLSLETLSA